VSGIGVFFTGETMCCILCDRQEKSDPRVESDWRCVVADGVRYYVCPDHFPPDGAGADAFRRVYDEVLRRIIELQGQRGPKS